MDWETFLLGHVEKAERIHQRSTNSALPALGHAAAPMHPSRQSDREVLAIAKISKPPGSRDTAVTATRNADTKSWVRLDGTGAMRGKIDPASEKLEWGYHSAEQKQHANEIKNAMLLNYLEQMKARRVELQAIASQPAWALVPVARIHNTSYAKDDETKEIGNMLEGFFNSSTLTILDEEIRQNATISRQGPSGKTLADVSQPENALSTNTVPHTESFLPLVPALPNFKHTTLSHMLKTLVEGSTLPKDEEKAAKEPTNETHQPVTFLSLPTRLREKIWNLAIQRPRIIELTTSTTYSTVSRAPVPPLLHTCQESRAIALQHYSVSFATPATSPKVYFDFKNDWVYTRCTGCLGTSCNHKLTLTADHLNVRHLVFEGPMSFNPFPKIVRFYPRLESLILVGGRSVVPRGEIDEAEIFPVDWQFDWAGEDDFLTLAQKAWREIEPSGEKKLKLKRVWHGTLPGVVDDLKRSSDAGKGLWTCCS